MELLGLQGIAPGKRLTKGNKRHKRYPYLLEGVTIDKKDQVWGADITYIRMYRGFVYLVAIMDWFSRYVVSWAISVSMEKEFCIEALHAALRSRRPEIFNTDQGSQFTSPQFTKVLERSAILISMDGRGRVFDNIFVERLWRTVKYEEVYLKEYITVKDAVRNLSGYFRFYNSDHPHQSLGYRTPSEVYHGT